MLAHFLIKKLSPRARIVIAAVLLDASVIGWPLSALTLARGEPQFVLGLSWFAIICTAFDVLCTSDVRESQDAK